MRVARFEPTVPGIVQPETLPLDRLDTQTRKKNIRTVHTLNSKNISLLPALGFK
jgi:hypothetical protein